MEKKKILIVDDEEEVVNFMESVLRRADYEVFSATSGRKAVELVEQTRPDLVILDIVMPDIGGGEVAEMIQKNPATQSIPIIFLTGIMSKDEKIRAEQRNKDKYSKYFTKPIEADELIEAVKNFVT